MKLTVVFLGVLSAGKAYAFAPTSSLGSTSTTKASFSANKCRMKAAGEAEPAGMGSIVSEHQPTSRKQMLQSVAAVGLDAVLLGGQASPSFAADVDYSKARSDIDGLKNKDASEGLTLVSESTTVSTPSGAFPQHSTTAGIFEVETKPDLRATKFSAQNAFYFASLSKIVYRPKKDVMGLVQGNSTCKGLGFDRFHWFEEKEERQKRDPHTIHDTEAFVAANDDMVAVVFRGTKEREDWRTNLNTRRRDLPETWGNDPGAVHEGFDDGVNTVWDSRKMKMQRMIKDLCGEANKKRKLYLAGHSLGGALATIAAARLAFEDDLDIAAVYTIGSPKVFESTAAANFDSKSNHGTPMRDKYFRCRNNNDIITRLPLDRTHVGTEIYLDQFGTISTASILDRLLGRLSALFRGELIDGINDHAADEYIRHFQQVVIDSRVALVKKAISAWNDAVGDVVLKVTPDEFVAKNENLQKLKRVKAVVEEVKEKAKEVAGKKPPFLTPEERLQYGIS